MTFKNLLKVSSICIKNFSKTEINNMKPSIKMIRNHLKLLKTF